MRPSKTSFSVKDAWESDDPRMQILRTAASRLLLQIAISRVRIESSWSLYLTTLFDPSYFLVRACLILDIETFYTIAADLLKILCQMIPPEGREKLQSETAYRRFMTIRNILIRHAYDKPNGDPHNGFAIGAVEGIMLKGGSPGSKFSDPGYFKNFQLFSELLDKYKVPPIQLPEESMQKLRLWR